MAYNQLPFIKSVVKINAYVVREYMGLFYENIFAKANKDSYYVFGKTSSVYIL